MSLSERNAILSNILRESSNQKITVTGVRDQILRRQPNTNLNKAALRRWVNGKFVTLVRQGGLTRHATEGKRKAFFTTTPVLAKAATNDGAAEPPHKPRSTDPKLGSGNSLAEIRKELENNRLKALTQLSEIDEYKRIMQHYPDLTQATNQRFSVAIDENCRTLGKIKALEEILEISAAQT